MSIGVISSAVSWIRSDCSEYPIFSFIAQEKDTGIEVRMQACVGFAVRGGTTQICGKARMK